MCARAHDRYGQARRSKISELEEFQDYDGPKIEIRVVPVVLTGCMCDKTHPWCWHAGKNVPDEYGDTTGDNHCYTNAHSSDYSETKCAKTCAFDYVEHPGCREVCYGRCEEEDYKDGCCCA